MAPPDSATDAPPLLDAAQLKAQGHLLAAPFQLETPDGDRIEVKHLLRVLPGKRIVGEGCWQGHHVLIKIFVSHHRTKDFSAESCGIAALAQAGIPTPEIEGSAQIKGGGIALFTRFLPSAESLASRWKRLRPNSRDNDAEIIPLVEDSFRLLGRAHAHQLIHHDLHFGNFLVDQGNVLLIDGDAVVPVSGATTQVFLENLAMLISQLSRDWDRHLEQWLLAYGAHSASNIDRKCLTAAVEKMRTKRLARYLSKTVRDCSEFSVHKTFARFECFRRNVADQLTSVRQELDATIARSDTIYKDGGTCTVAKVIVAGTPLVIKRYNIKSIAHALSRSYRPSRAWHSWKAANMLRHLGIATPQPLALIENRFGPLRRQAYLMTEYCPGSNLLQHLNCNGEPKAAEAAAINRLFNRLFQEKITHGDLKANNLLWFANELYVIDLDAMKRHTSSTQFSRAWNRDRSRFLRNWPEASVLHRWLDAAIPHA